MTMAPTLIRVTQWYTDGGCQLTFAEPINGGDLGFLNVSLTAAQVADFKARLERPADR